MRLRLRIVGNWRGGRVFLHDRLSERRELTLGGGFLKLAILLGEHLNQPAPCSLRVTPEVDFSGSVGAVEVSALGLVDARQPQAREIFGITFGFTGFFSGEWFFCHFVVPYRALEGMTSKDELLCFRYVFPLKHGSDLTKWQGQKRTFRAVKYDTKRKVGTPRFELGTSALSGRRSNQLSYMPE